MIKEHRRPLLAFVVVLVACAVIIVSGLRSEAVRGFLGLPTPEVQSVLAGSEVDRLAEPPAAPPEPVPTAVPRTRPAPTSPRPHRVVGEVRVTKPRRPSVVATAHTPIVPATQPTTQPTIPSAPSTEPASEPRPDRGRGHRSHQDKQGRPDESGHRGPGHSEGHSQGRGHGEPEKGSGDRGDRDRGDRGRDQEKRGDRHGGDHGHGHGGGRGRR
ncbi:hypothetical protein [Nocardioides sp. CCNWLW212]|uniref:hypothetical protein n=1 Tax=Nocardioides sp. CCNWLW212 TaxID=3128897 RepID=UPI00307D5AB7